MNPTPSQPSMSLTRARSGLGAGARDRARNSRLTDPNLGLVVKPGQLDINSGQLLVAPRLLMAGTLTPKRGNVVRSGRHQ